MNFRLKQMTKVADRPRGIWGRAMLRRMHRRHQKLIRWGLSFASPREATRILDIGCGSGNSLAILYAGNREARYDGIDVSRASVREARRNNRRATRRGHMNIVQGDVLHLPYEDQTFDFILSVESFYYWKDYEKAMNEIFRVLSPGGTLLIILEDHLEDGETMKDHGVTDLVEMFLPATEDIKRIFSRAGLGTTIHFKDRWMAIIGEK